MNDAFLKSLTESENWVWQTLLNGETADLNLHDQHSPDPIKAEEWTLKRVLRPKMLNKLLEELEGNRTLPTPGIRIVGAWFLEPLDLSKLKINIEFSITNSRFEESICLDHARLTDLLILDGSYLHAGLSFAHLQSTRSIYLRGTITQQTLEMEELSTTESLDFRLMVGAGINLMGARISRYLILEGVRLNGLLKMESAFIGSNALLGYKSEFGDISLSSAEISGSLRLATSKARQVDLYSITIRKALDLGFSTLESIYVQSGSVGQSVYDAYTTIKEADFSWSSIEGGILIRNATITHLKLSSLKTRGDVQADYTKPKDESEIDQPTAISTIDLSYAQIKGNVNFSRIEVQGSVNMQGMSIGQLIVSETTIKGDFNADGIAVTGDMVLENSFFGGSVSSFDSTVNGSLFARNCTVYSFNLGKTTINNRLQIGDRLSGNKWLEGGLLDLSNVVAGTLAYGGEHSWPDCLELDGFRYDTLIGEAERKAKSYKKWLQRDRSGSSQPYQYLAQLLFKTGLTEDANRILFAAKNRERRTAWKTGQRWKWFGLTMLKWTIGYGYGPRYFYSLFWVVGITAVGTLVLSKAPDPDILKFSVLHRFGISFNLLLPKIIQLDANMKIALKGWHAAYFYFQGMMGYVLSSFIVAGLAGITKK